MMTQTTRKAKEGLGPSASFALRVVLYTVVFIIITSIIAIYY